MPSVQALMRAATAATVLAVVAALLGIAAAPSHAVPGTPGGLDPTGTTAAGIPVLTWDRVPAATTYDVQVSRSSTFSSTVWTVSTVNHQAVPTVQLSKGDVYWRVRARQGGEIGDWATASFVRADVGGPVLSSPDDGEELQQPDELPALAWNPVSGARDYTIQISIDPNFTDPALISTHQTASTSFVLTNLGVPNVYFWRVRGDLDNAVTTEWSTVRSYKILGLALPEPWLPTTPRMNDDANVFTYVRDTVLDWEPVPGATTYALQVSTDENFNTVLETKTGITGTSYARPKTLNNDQYYWRVRPVDASGNTLDWSDVPIWKFGRNWPYQPTLEFPQHNATVGDPFYYQWTGVEHGSRYVVQVSAYADFQVPEGGTPNMSCATTHTTWTPRTTSRAQCWPVAEGTYYWRVQALDEFASDAPVTDVTVGVTPVHRFHYRPDRVTITSPAPGSTTSTPVLAWEPLARAARYRVEITNVDTGDRVANAVTSALTYTPRTRLEAGVYRWHVVPVAQGGYEGSGLLPGSQYLFTVADEPDGEGSLPEPDPSQDSTTGGTFHRFPTLHWSPVTGATHYQVWIRQSGTITFEDLDDSFVYPFGEDDTSKYLAPGGYEWMVEAWDGSRLISESHSLGEFTIVPSDRVVGHQVALTGNAFTGAAGATEDHCNAGLPEECQDLRQTPVLGWDASPDAGYYRLYLSRDPELTNLVMPPVEVHSTMWASPETLPDSQAGSAYFWDVVPCTSGVCSPPTHAAHAFNKLSNKVTLVTPGVAVGTPQSPRPVRSDDITLDWDDYLATEGVAAQGTSALRTPARTEARFYRVQTATDPAFANLLEQADVDQTSFTSFANTYPEGPIYWRVQAFDGTDNPLPWSDVKTFQKESPRPTLVFPSTDEVVRGQQRFSWSSLPFAASYDVEIYRKDGVTETRIVNASTKQVSFTPTTPLPANAVYTWRVRRGDAKGRKGAWSDPVPFTVAGDAPTMLSPAQGAELTPIDALFAWAADPRAGSYRFERRLPGSASIAKTVNTPALSWASDTALPGGTWQWRVSSFDSAGALLDTSNWRDFTVGDTPEVVTPVAITGSGKVGTQLTLTPPVWDIPDVVTTYQWLRDGANIRNATGESYVVSANDVGGALSVRATGTRTGYQPGSSVSNAVGGALGATLLPSEPPSILGIPAVGQTLTASEGSWPGDPDFDYQWLRSGVPIAGADNRTYRVQVGDAGRALTVRVTARVDGYVPGQASASPLAIRRIASRTTVLAPKTISAKKRAHLEVSVTAEGVDSPSGSVRIYVGSRLLRTVTLTARMRGEFPVTLPRLKRGRQTVKAVYSGSSATTGSTKSVRIRVTR